MILDIFEEEINLNNNYIDLIGKKMDYKNQKQTTQAFSNKWNEYDKCKNKEPFHKMQRNWYLELYGFKNENEFADFLKGKKIIFDAGCGLGYKAAWFAELSPDSIVLGMDISDATSIAAKQYRNIENLFFIKGDISVTRIKNKKIDYISCDQVLHHTEDPETTLKELVRILKLDGELYCYVYRKKALPRELIDEHFRTKCKDLSHQELLEFSRQLTEIGKNLSELNITVNIPDIPLLDIKGGSYDIQRFIYWNFLKCFWNKELGYETSVITNYDWYSPSNAKRYLKDEFITLAIENNLKTIHFHEEEACYSGRFLKS